MSDNDVPDSTDWLQTPLSGLAAVEAALRCQVCKDFYKTPMITSCSHTFCSLCIRRALSNEGRCPLCRTSEQELKLRSNWSVEETVEAFTKARSASLDVARAARVAESSPKRKAGGDTSLESSTASGAKRLRTSARLKNRSESSQSIERHEDDVVDFGTAVEAVDDDEDEYVPEAPDGLVPCPVCENRMKEWQVFKHLETCSGPTPKQKAAESSGSAPYLGSIPRQHDKALERLPAVSYSMLKEQALRKKMAELGISNQGPRQLLERRHKEWITLWNANCDAARPKKRSELLQDLDMWERTQGGRAPTTGRSVQNAAVIKDKDFDGAAWAAKHDDSFKDLIANARRSRQEAQRTAEENNTDGDTSKESGAGQGAQPADLDPAGDPPDAAQAGPTRISESPPRPVVAHADSAALDLDISAPDAWNQDRQEDRDSPQVQDDWKPQHQNHEALLVYSQDAVNPH